MTIRYKVLTYLGIPIDEKLLTKGLYGTDTPILHDKDMDLDGLVKMYDTNLRFMSIPNELKYIALGNLENCELTDVELSYIKK